MSRHFLRRLVHLLTIGTLLAMLPAILNAAVLPGQNAPNFRVVTTSGQRVSLDNYRDHVLVIDFFATWCSPCRESVPHLVELNRKYGRQGLQILGLSVDEDGERVVRNFADDRRVNYPMALASEAVQADFGLRAVPVMFVIDRKGRVAEIFRGYNGEIGRSLEQLIKRLLTEK